MHWLYNNTEEFFYIDVSSFLSNREIDFADIDEVKYLVKDKRSDCDGDAIVTLTYQFGVELDATRNYLAVSFREEDYDTGKLEIGGRYYVGVALKTPDMTDYLEVSLTDDRLYITSSFFVDCV